MIVGRGRPLAVLAEAVAALGRGRGGFVLVAGEAGIGKTSLLTAAAGHAAKAGALAVSGACWDGGGAPGYWPWIQVVRSLERAVGTGEWPAIRRAGGDGLGLLLGEDSASRASPGGQPTAGTLPDFQVLDAVAAVLIAAAARQPILVLLDDLQWADPASIRMLDFVVRHSALSQVLVLAAYRDTELVSPENPAGPPLAAAVTGATIVQLAGLDEEAVTELVSQTAGGRPDPRIAAEICRRTGGNPFFVQQVAGLWSATGTIAGVAPGLRDTIDRRIAQLTPECSDLLMTAALLGGEFDARVAAAATGTSEAAARQILAAAIAARIVLIGPDGTFRFVHDLIREHLRDQLDDAGARQRHATIVRAADAAAGTGRPLLPAQVAAHAYRAVPDIDVTTAARRLMDAGKDASRRHAAEEACGHFRRARELLAAQGMAGSADAAIQLGIHQRQSGDIDAARRTFGEVIAVARDSGDAGSFAGGVLGLHSLGLAFRDGSDAVVTLVGEARSRLSADPGHAGGSPLLAMIMAAEGQEASHSLGNDPPALERLSADALAMARRHGEIESLCFCLLARHDAIWRPGTASERLAIADEVLALSRRTADRELELQARHLRVVALLEAGDPQSLAEHESFVVLAERTRWPRFRYTALARQATVATLQGRFAEARRLVDAAADLGHQIGEVDTESVRHDQLWELARLQGHQGDIDAMIAADRLSGNPLGAVIAGLTAVDSGDAGMAAERADEAVRVAGIWPRWAGLMWMTYRAQLAALLRDRRIGAVTRAEIEPVRENWAVLAGAVIVHGPMRHWLAVLDAAEQRWEEAIAGFTAAERAADALNARPWSVLARLECAAAILGLGDQPAARQAAKLLDHVEKDARELGLAPAAARAVQLKAVTGAGFVPDQESGPDLAATTRAAGSSAQIFRFDGEVWTLTFAGTTALLADAKGMHDLRELLAHPGTDISATALLGLTDGTGTAAVAGADPVLDEKAKAEYRARLTTLEDEIDAAMTRQDDQHAERLEREREALLGALRVAFGLGGRPRRLGSESERARKAVTARIKDALRRLDSRHPPLARHLRSTVSTGTYCCYRPPVAVSMRWRL